MVKVIEKSKLELICVGGVIKPGEEALSSNLLNSLKRQETHTALGVMVLENEDEIRSFMNFFIEKTGNIELANTLKSSIYANNGAYYYAIREEFTAFFDYLDKH